jgi:hypothetical protein
MKPVTKKETSVIVFPTTDANIIQRRRTLTTPKEEIYHIKRIIHLQQIK